MKEKLEIFHRFWQQTQPYEKRTEFAENYVHWDVNEGLYPSPKALGFVISSPKISLTPAGIELVNTKRKEEIFLRQLLKFQVPSPYHRPTENAADFWVKPYLELFRLIRHFGSLKFDELRLFGLQLTDYRYFDTIVSKINRFRSERALNQSKYNKFYREYLNSELRDIFNDRIQSGKTKTRETKDASTMKFLKTQEANMRDYADACIRYLRVTGMVNISHIGKSISSNISAGGIL